ncbi:MAG: class II aldolase/adducin family protein [Candidatus Limiplasma sp.]|nr:class II aldolase/adducin family protein [Candidatus Limiplasma sp.]
MNYKQLIVESGVKMLQGGYTVETWGNISYRDPETQRVYITPSGMDYATLAEEDVVVVDLQGNILEGGRRPSIETGLHCAIYRARGEINAVIHTHPIYSMVFSCTGEDIPLLMDEAAQCMGDTCYTAEYALPGSPELAQNCVKALGEKANACLLKSHGAVCLGGDMKSAFRVVKVLEVTAQIYQMIRSMGGCYCPISQENIEKMQYFVCNLYGQV